MQAVSFKRHRFPPDVIRQAVWLYFRFTLSLRDVEEMLAERGIETNYETIRCCTLKFGRLFAQNLRRSRPEPTCPFRKLYPTLLMVKPSQDIGRDDVAIALDRAAVGCVFA